MLVGLVLVALLLLVLGLVLWGVGIYNGLVALDNQCAQAWSNIDVLLKQRHDEVPKLVEVCKGYMAHERETLERVIEARDHALRARDAAEASRAEAGLARALSGLFAVVERYPELKANQNFLALQRRISQLEDQIADRRELYNAAVNHWNTRIRQLPDVLVARFLNAVPKPLYAAAEDDRRDVEVKF